MKFEFTILIIVISTYVAKAAVDCNKMGRGIFADPDDSECRKYTWCVYVITPVCAYKNYEYSCPVNSVFDPSVSICTSITNYVCKPKKPACTAEGFFPAPGSANCSSYITCMNVNGEFEQVMEEKCPDGTAYNPDSTLCETDYQCDDKSVCNAAGLTANPADKTCQSYYYCKQQSDGEFTEYEFRCPGIWKYHPVFKVCTPYYDCPK